MRGGFLQLGLARTHPFLAFLHQNMVLADRVHAAGLWALLTHVFYKIDGCAHLQFVQVIAYQAVAVKVKPSAVHRFDTTEYFVG